MRVRTCGRDKVVKDGDDLMAARVQAARLRQLGVTVIVGYKGTIVGACPFDRAGKHAERDFS